MADAQIYDLTISTGQTLGSDDTLVTAITISLLSNARALTDDVIPDPTDRKGWWGDTYSDVPDDRFGSRIWQATGQGITADLMTKLDQWIRECLQWLIDDGWIGGLDVDLAQVRPSVIGATIGVRRPQNGTVVALGVWEISLNAV